ncbi:DNA-binding transcriptional regulator PaaX [Streptacidiphilus sp. MAP12-16]|uniref:Chromate resistance protein ChrB n=1 Tax=Streptacidiphilus sp. MAP12-16 TaxID=3156300 RepID=UPI003513D028
MGKHVADVAKAGSRSEGDAADPGGWRWLVLVYKVPVEPTRLRAGVWRKIKGLGAIYLQNSVAALPQTAAAERSFRVLRNEITEMGGSAYLLVSQVLAGSAEMVQAFNAARDDEYEEIVDRCQDFLKEIEKEYRAEHFTYAELEENDEDLVKLRNWFAKVHARDVLGASGVAATRSALQRCEEVLDEYAARVYAEEGESR